MRLSDVQKFLFLLFLINSLTLLIKSNADAQAVLPVNNFAYNDNGSSRHLFNGPGDDSTPIYAAAPENDKAPAGIKGVSAFYFYRSSESPYLKPFRYYLVKNNNKTDQAQHTLLARVYSVSLKNNARLTFKLFKLVIVPLWR